MGEAKQYRVKKPIGWGGRREIGETVFMSDEQAAAFGDEYVVPESEPVTTGAKVEDEAAVKPKRRVRAKK